MVLFSAACERFYRRVGDIKNDCAVALNEHPEQGKTILLPVRYCGVFRKTIKNLLRLCEVRFSKMRVCGLFTVDAILLSGCWA
ncbi:hypothetical protein EVAR_83519_1 [Eumeta japonica]|uniref:Uncharacterized protein n=1 Tax=Eumeta variegata TaxID=151549 RepID=A0A4C1XYU4_EUMVA|nr:hypothetical protein EVAR_83519_1 [Eumeta japonica]